METLGARLRRLRVERHFSIKEMAEKLGVSVSTYRDWEYGRAIKGEPYLKIAEVFEIGLTELLTGNKPNKGNAKAEFEEIERHLHLLKKELAPLLE